jgi:hypothetical protein
LYIALTYARIASSNHDAMCHANYAVSQADVLLCVRRKQDVLAAKTTDQVKE